MKFRIIKTIDQDDNAYDDIFFVEEEENIEEKLDKLREYERDYENLDREEFEEKYNCIGVYELISDYIEVNFKVIEDYEVSEFYI